MQPFAIEETETWRSSMQKKQLNEQLYRRNQDLTFQYAKKQLNEQLYKVHLNHFPLNLHTGRPLTERDYTRCCISAIWPADDEHDVARNM